jgi:hypothetical protein
MHDGIRADVLYALKGAADNDTKVIESAAADLKEHTEIITGRIADNASLVTNETIKKALDEVDAP